MVIDIIGLDCYGAVVDSEALMTAFLKRGVRIEQEHAELIVINTGGLFEPCLMETLEGLQQYSVILTGCAHHVAAYIKQYYPEVVIFCDDSSYDTIIGSVMAMLVTPQPDATADEELLSLPDHGVKLTPAHYAYLNLTRQGISGHTLRELSLNDFLSVEDVYETGKSLAVSGVQELLLVAHDAGACGDRLASFCKALEPLNIWLRVHNVTSYEAVDGLLPVMQASVVLPYVDIALRTLHTDSEAFSEYCSGLSEHIALWRRDVPELTVHMSVTIGSADETEQHIDALSNLMADVRFNRVTINQDLCGGCEEERLTRRIEMLEALQQDICSEYLDDSVGAMVPVMIDDVVEGEIEGEPIQNIALGRCVGDAPHAGGIVQVEDIYGSVPGQIVHVEILESTGHDVIAIPA